MAKQAILGHQATILVIDGLSTINALSESDIALKQFLRLLQAYCQS